MGFLNGCEAWNKSEDMEVGERTSSIYIAGGKDLPKESGEGQRADKRVAGTHILTNSLLVLTLVARKAEFDNIDNRVILCQIPLP
jgi:hypothetical protein